MKRTMLAWRWITVAAVLAIGGAAVHAQADRLEVDSEPTLRTWAAPVYPAEALKAKLGGTVKLRFTVDAAGKVISARVLESPDARLSEAAEAAVNQWTFAPGVENHAYIPYSMEVGIAFDPAKKFPKKKNALLPPWDVTAAARVDAEAKTVPPGDYPPILSKRLIPGKVQFTGVVSPEGHVSLTRVTGASHVDFILPSVETLKKWEFKPARQGDLPASSVINGEVTFDTMEGQRGDVLKMNGLAGPDGNLPDDIPEPRAVVDPVWPYAQLLRGEEGRAVVAFRVNPNGSLGNIEVREASRPEFGAALVAALECCAFEPAVSGGQSVSVDLVKTQEFKVTAATDADPEVARLLAAIKANTLESAKGLDAPLTPIYQVAPTYPSALRDKGSPAGQATIQFIIDREGRARLPQVISATGDEFGWAAATAVSQWVFKAPHRGGKLVDVKVQIPIEFAAGG